MKQTCVALLLLTFLFSCNKNKNAGKKPQPYSAADTVLAPSQGPDDGSPMQKPKYISRFAKTFLDFQTAIFNSDTATINQFIDPELGLFIIETPGAVPKITFVKDITTFKRSQYNLSIFSLKEQICTCALKEETLPGFNCQNQTGNKSGYSKEGCFVGSDTSFQNSDIYKFANLPEQTQLAFQKSKKLTDRTVLQTSSSYRFHFGLVKNKMRLLFIDLRVPCSA